MIHWIKRPVPDDFRQRMAKLFTGSCQSIIEAVAWIVHLIDPEYGLQTPFVKAGIVSHEG